MKAPLEPSTLLDRGKPTIRELLSNLVFNPVDGTIRLNGDRIVMQRAAVGIGPPPGAGPSAGSTGSARLPDAAGIPFRAG